MLTSYVPAPQCPVSRHCSGDATGQSRAVRALGACHGCAHIGTLRCERSPILAGPVHRRRMLRSSLLDGKPWSPDRSQACTASFLQPLLSVAAVQGSACSGLVRPHQHASSPLACSAGKSILRATLE